MKISECETIVDEKKFIEAHAATIERNVTKSYVDGDAENVNYFYSFVERLKKYHEIKQQGNTTDKVI